MPQRHGERVNWRWAGIWILVLGCDRVDPSNGAIDRRFGPSREEIPREVDEAYDRIVHACRERDPALLWSTFDVRRRQQLELQAKRALEDSRDEGRFRSTYEFWGDPSEFNGQAYLWGRLQGPARMCSDTATWRRVDAELNEGDWQIVIERADGDRYALVFTEVEPGEWRLTEPPTSAQQERS